MKHVVLNVNIDTLEVAFQGALPGASLDHFAAEKERAELEGEPQYMEFNGLAGEILPNGAKGGYRYILNQGPLAVKWQIKHNADPSKWNFYARVPSGMLIDMGFREVVKTLYAELGAMGTKVMSDSVSRFDICADILMPGFELKPENITCHSASTIKRHYSKDYTKSDENHVSVVGGARVETVTIGKMPGRQIQIYDKRKQAIKKKLSHWFDIWGRSPKDKEPIWRVEFRAGKNHLKDWNIRTLKQLMSKAGDMARAAFDEVRYLQDRHSSNVTYSKVHSIWKAAKAEIANFLTFATSGAKRGLVKECLKDEKTKQIGAMVTGLAATLGFLDKVPLMRKIETGHVADGPHLNDEIFCQISDMVSGIMFRNYERSPSEFFKKINAASRRYHFLEREYEYA